MIGRTQFKCQSNGEASACLSNRTFLLAPTPPSKFAKYRLLPESRYATRDLRKTAPSTRRRTASAWLLVKWLRAQRKKLPKEWSSISLSLTSLSLSLSLSNILFLKFINIDTHLHLLGRNSFFLSFFLSFFHSNLLGSFFLSFFFFFLICSVLSFFPSFFLILLGSF